MNWTLSVLVALGAAWLGYLTLARLASLAVRPRPVRPGPAAPDLPADPPPAVVGYLVNGCRVDPDAAVATLVDLAARGHLELHQPGNDPRQTVIRVRDRNPSDLTPYEQRVFDRAAAAAGPHGTVTLAELATGHAAEGNRWAAAFEQEVAADAKARKLTTNGPDGIVVVFLMLGFVLSCVTGALLPSLALSSPETGEDSPGAWYGIAALVLGAIIFMVSLVPVVTWFDRPHRSAAGRETTARWLGVARWLNGHGSSFHKLPPSAVTVWDRYLSYGAALGATPVVSQAVDLAVGTREVLWSQHTGEWRQIRVRYPRRGRAPGYPPLTVIISAALVLGLVAGGLWYARGLTNEAVVYAASAVGGLLGLRSLYRASRAFVDLLAPADIIGLVLTRSTIPHLTGLADVDSGPGGRFLRAATRTDRVPYFVVVDDGRHDVAIVWTAYPIYRRTGQCQAGDLVRLRGYRWCRSVRSVAVLPPTQTVVAAAEHSLG